ncbi:MAG: TonB C-terminal domain-containing protein [Epsilonproteobacteria bacterium]|nr:TonB C-terminal domain-containing protein [Campylobacterota bacterium]
MQNRTFGLQKEQFIAVSVVISPQKNSSKASDKTTPHVQTQKSEDININHLFDNVWTQKIDTKPQEKKIDLKRIQEISRRIEKSKVNKPLSSTQKIESHSHDSKSQKGASSAQQVNEYLAKIQAIVYDNFMPPANSEGNVVRVVIELDALGKIRDFRVLNYSSNDALNSEVDQMKQRLKRVVFPMNPQKRSFRAVINLIPENKE